MFGGIGAEFQCLQQQDKNSSDWKDKVRILTFRRIRSEFQCSEG